MGRVSEGGRRQGELRWAGWDAELATMRGRAAEMVVWLQLCLRCLGAVARSAVIAMIAVIGGVIAVARSAVDPLGCLAPLNQRTCTLS